MGGEGTRMEPRRSPGCACLAKILAGYCLRSPVPRADSDSAKGQGVAGAGQRLGGTQAAGGGSKDIVGTLEGAVSGEWGRWQNTEG